MEVKCTWCKNKHKKSEMVCEEKKTGKLNKNGTPKMNRKYYHQSCYEKYLADKAFKKKELKELDDLYNHIKKLHDLSILDGRMMEKIQDLRNGSIKIKNKKIKRYKEGVPYNLMFQGYSHCSKKIDYALKNNEFKTKWNEFSYVFAIVANSLNELIAMNKLNEKAALNTKINRNLSDVDLEIRTKKNSKKDDFDISEFL